MDRKIYPVRDCKISNGAYRIIDANFNRAQEGLRVCEEVARFIFEAKDLNLEFKKSRHKIKDICQKLPCAFKKNLLYFRESNLDVGRVASILENKRRGSKDIFSANIQRVKESLRVLEEFSKLINPQLSNKFKELRYDIYTLEKKTLERF